MTPDDQSAVTAFLGAAGGEVIETHISRVFLSGDRAFKLKRAVRLPYADFSTPARRLAYCEREIALNAPFAPEIYLGVRRITRAADGGLVFDGDGPLVDAAVEMVRFDQAALFDRMAAAGWLSPALIEALAGQIAAYHDRAPVRGGGGAANMAGVLDINAAGFATSRVFSRGEVAALGTRFRRALARHAGLLNRRAAQGRIRRCHGDLHLRNICLVEGAPRLFDCIEFSEQLATVDVLYDLAFLLMDLWHRGMAGVANRLANRYLDLTGDEAGAGLLPFFMAVRAAVRAHVTATFAEGAEEGAGAAADTARSYFALAAALLDPAPAPVVVLGGFSGSGKTTVAEALAPRMGPPPGARIVESDRTRKALFGLAPDARLPESAYAPEVSDRVYARLGRRGRGLAAAGVPVIVDAVFDRAGRRAAAVAALSAAGRPVTAVWLDAPAETLRGRVAARRGGPSDAGLAVLEAQLARGTGAIGWARVDAARPVAAIVDEILALPAAAAAV
ncbi:aminoglycoside phosphotransferase family enzyme/predicted kinase [Rhodovulum iodosum]|uniref:Aminoglycoside phosphotransferase family enzyme/predicted kinase n=1 Tax=Rhodovulum iodosum TaxID=68291 RepID=A0ABV3XP62_9RHOB|nr:bifunctional aminoglycoside phosphotransferase/ATP-binding protein [Rhodovulum robiginosum]RSK31586.1 aminoglycoside phosphotransferase [Rhodovulum robiginosum]